MIRTLSHNDIAMNSISFKKNNYNYYSSSNSKTKRAAIGAASFFVPGLGQVINGENGKGAAFFLASICNYLLYKQKNNRFLAGMGAMIISIWAAYDAYKKA